MCYIILGLDAIGKLFTYDNNVQQLFEKLYCGMSLRNTLKKYFDKIILKVHCLKAVYLA